MEIFPFLFHSCLSRIILLKVSLLFYWSLIFVWTDIFHIFKKWQVCRSCPVLSLFDDSEITHIQENFGSVFLEAVLCLILHTFLSVMPKCVWEQRKFAWNMCLCFLPSSLIIYSTWA
jgi:hypothetical protein